MQNRITYQPDWAAPEDFYDEYEAYPDEDWQFEPGYEIEEWAEPVFENMQVYIGIAIFLFALFVLARISPLTSGARPQPEAFAPVQSAAVSSSNTIGLPAVEAPDPKQFVAPYERYVVTQGLHGFSYGHAAVDLAAGKGSPVRSPINGKVTDVYVDQYGNPTIIIENEVYLVTMLHGEYDARAGENVAAGDPVGIESNLGYTTDMNGVRCTGRPNCGYHTHLNVYDKESGENVNPLNLIGP